jgi:hypothetical protein
MEMEMKKIVGFLCAVYSLTPISLFAGAAGDITTNSQVLGCAGQGVTCNFAMNAVGDSKEIYINSTTPTYNLGAISKVRTIQITVPLENSQKLFTFSTTQPYSVPGKPVDALDKAMVGRIMDVMLVSSAPDNQVLGLTGAAAKIRSMIKIYRRMQDEDPTGKGLGLWTEAYTVISQADVSQLLPVTIVISPDGTTKLDVEGRTVTLLLGKALLG